MSAHVFIPASVAPSGWLDASNLDLQTLADAPSQEVSEF